MIFVGLACTVAALICLALLIQTTDDLALAFTLAAGVCFFSMGAYASFFRPGNWSRLLNWGTTSDATTISAQVQNKGLVIGSLFYLAAIVCMAAMMIALGMDQILIAIGLSSPLFSLGVAVHIWTLVLKTRSSRRRIDDV